MKSIVGETFAIFGVIVLAIEITTLFFGHSTLSDFYQYIVMLIIAFSLAGFPVLFRRFSRK